MDQDTQISAESPTEDVGFDLRRHGLVLWKRRWVILGTLAVVVTATVALAARKPRVYESSVSVVIDPQAPNSLGQNAGQVVSLGSGMPWGNNPEYYNTQKQILGSYDLSKMVVTTYGLHRDPRIVGDVPSGATEDEQITIAANRLRGRISAQEIRESRILRIYVQDGDPDLAMKLANDVGNVYIDQNLKLKTVVTRDAKRFVAKMLDDAQVKLAESEAALNDYMRTNNMLSVSLQDRLNSVSKALEVFSGSLTEAQRQRIEIESRRAAFAAALQEDPSSLAPAVNGTESTGMPDLQRLYLEEERKLDVLEQRYGPQHPEVMAQKARASSALEALRTQGRTMIRSMDAQIQALNSVEREYGKKVAALTQEALDLNHRAIEHKRLARDSDNAEMVYNQLLRRYNDSALQEQDLANNIRLLDEARGARLVEPDPVKAGTFGAALGLVLGLGLAYALEYLDRSVKSQHDIEQVVKLPFLGLVPSIDPATSKGENLDQYVLSHPKSTIAESCRVVRTNILFCSPDRPLKTILVTSSNPSEGKTINCVNLGIVMAQSGQRTLLVDTDMRRPRLHKAFGVSNENGVSRLIVGESDIASAIKSTDAPGLFILPCGPIPPNPAELLQTESFGNLLKTLSSQFDRVILDSPPVHAVTDAAVLSSYADGTVLVVRAGTTTRDAVVRAKEVLRSVGSNIAGVVLNDVNLKSPHYASYYYYYQYQYKYHEQGAVVPKSGDQA